LWLAWEAAYDYTLRIAHLNFSIFIDILLCWYYVIAWCECIRRAEDDRAQGEVVEDVAAVAPYIGAAVFPQAFVVEPIYCRDLAGLVVAAD
jgi:hypothetical protein